MNPSVTTIELCQTGTVPAVNSGYLQTVCAWDKTKTEISVRPDRFYTQFTAAAAAAAAHS